MRPPRPSSRWPRPSKGRDVLLFNVSAPDDSLRRDLCAREIVHTYPEPRDAHGCADAVSGVAQMARHPGARRAAAGRCRWPRRRFARSAQKFGARIVADQHFKPGTDPREREQNDPLLLTADARQLRRRVRRRRRLRFRPPGALSHRAAAAGGRQHRSRAGRPGTGPGNTTARRRSIRASTSAPAAATWKAPTGRPGSP